MGVDGSDAAVVVSVGSVEDNFGSLSRALGICVVVIVPPVMYVMSCEFNPEHLAIKNI